LAGAVWNFAVEKELFLNIWKVSDVTTLMLVIQFSSLLLLACLWFSKIYGCLSELWFNCKWF
jgi:hypothetical protein